MPGGDVIRLKIETVREIEAETPVSLTGEIYFSIKILDLWGQTQLEQVETVKMVKIERETQY